jgi:hypothetical protein
MKSNNKIRTPWVIVTHHDGVYWLGHAEDEAHAWCIALGWPDQAEIDSHKAEGWYAAQATVSWRRPA